MFHRLLTPSAFRRCQASLSNPAATVAASLLITASGIGSARSLTATEGQPPQRPTRPPGKGDDSESDETEKEGSVFDIAKDWVDDMKKEGSKFLDEFILSSDERPDCKNEDGENPTAPSSGFDRIVKEVLGNDVESKYGDSGDEGNSGILVSLTKTFAALISGQESSEDAMKNLIQRAQKSTDVGDIGDTRSFVEIASLFDQSLAEVKDAMVRSFGHLDFTKLDLTTVGYFLEREDAKKNPSWKRMKHRYHRGVDVREVADLNDALYLAKLSYADTVEDIKDGLEKAKDQWELVYCETESYPGQPSHFLAVKKGQSRWSSVLEVLLVVRGTKSIPDLFTDALLEAEDYRGGKAHAGIVRSGKYLVDRHKDFLEKLLKLSSKRQVKLSLVGHSLGAGAASIAGMELNDDDRFEVSVVGFGCPALLSEELSKSTERYITTVIGDSDVVPRMSAATIANVALDIMENDWTGLARRDIGHAFEELSAASPTLVPKSNMDSAMSLVDSAIDKYLKPRIKAPTTERMQPVLFPPGSCVHFYRDGKGISGAYAPCTFFTEIDIARTMLDDHSIARGYGRIFLELMRDYHADAHFSFEGKEDIC